MQKIIDFMGDESVWKTMVPDVTIRRRPRTRHVPQGHVAYFVDSHWTAPGFDPYDRYQRPGTHKFCQTFVMMHFLGLLPEPSTYLVHDAYAMEFILKVIESLPDDHPGFLNEKSSLLSELLSRM
jgi:hypothetical protein